MSENLTRLHIIYDDFIQLEMDPNYVYQNEEVIYEIVKQRISDQVKNNLDDLLKKIKIEVSDLDELEDQKHRQPRRRRTTHHFESMPKIFEYLMERKKPKKRALKRKSTMGVVEGNNLKKNFSYLKPQDTEKLPFLRDASAMNLKEENDSIKSYENLYDLDKKEDAGSLEGDGSLTEKDIRNPFHFNAPDEKTGLSLLSCDKFKESYESTLCTSADLNTSAIDFSKNYHLAILFGNISYSLGMYDKAIHFYNLALQTVTLLTHDKYIENVNISLLENNIGRSLVNKFKVRDGIEHLNTAKSKLEHSEASYAIILKLFINFNLAEAYYLMENFEQSINLLIEIHESLSKNKSILEQEENAKMLCKYYFSVGKIYLKMNNYSVALENFMCSKSLNLEIKNDCISQAELNNYLSTIYLNTNKYDKAVQHMEDCIKTLTEIYGVNHPKTLMASTNLSYIFQNNSENRQALELLESTLKNATMNKELDDIFIAIVYRAIGNCYFNIGNERQGLVHFSKANVIYKEYMSANLLTISEVNIILENMYGMINV
jgi:tetratricopeptide (TPR) repeat protein